MARGLALALIVAGGTQAQDARTLRGAEIAEALTGRLVTYDSGATQRFLASGRTLYTHGEPSWGMWEVRGDAYCSQWPPSPDWDCYEVRRIGADGIGFVDSRGNDFVGTVVAE